MEARALEKQAARERRKRSLLEGLAAGTERDSTADQKEGPGREFIRGSATERRSAAAGAEMPSCPFLRASVGSTEYDGVAATHAAEHVVEERARHPNTPVEARRGSLTPVSARPPSPESWSREVEDARGPARPVPPVQSRAARAVPRTDLYC